MTEQEKFDVTVAAFEALLVKNGLWKEYLINFRKSNPYRKSEEKFAFWKEWALPTPPFQWISGAFVWDDTPEGHLTWKEMDYTWLRVFCRNLNN